jgi:hypothetical protein
VVHDPGDSGHDRLDRARSQPRGQLSHEGREIVDEGISVGGITDGPGDLAPKRPAEVGDRGAQGPASGVDPDDQALVAEFDDARWPPDPGSPEGILAKDASTPESTDRPTNRRRREACGLDELGPGRARSLGKDFEDRDRRV